MPINFKRHRQSSLKYLSMLGVIIFALGSLISTACGPIRLIVEHGKTVEKLDAQTRS